MEVDCCSPEMCSSIVCSAVCADSCGPEVLLGPNLGGPGMLCAGFVRPPVDVYLQFHQPVNLAAVKLGLRWQRQLVTGVVLWTLDQSLETEQNHSYSHSTVASCSAIGDTNSNHDRRNVYSLPDPSSQVSTAVSTHGSQASLRVDSAVPRQRFFSDGGLQSSAPLPITAAAAETNIHCEHLRRLPWRKAGVFMYDSYRRRYSRGDSERHLPSDLSRWHGSVQFTTPAHERRQCSDGKAGVDCGADVTNAQLHSGIATRNVRVLRISLVRVLGASAVCLRQLSVWALARTSNSARNIATTPVNNKRTVVNSCDNYYGSGQGIPLNDTGVDRRHNTHRECVTVDGESGSPGSKPARTLLPPEDLLDALTCEVMEVPMQLPSGHMVDRSTVQRCAALDASRGRCPRDPFTGVPFSNTCRPVAAPVAFKSRLDHFLFELDTYSIGRARERVVSYPGRTVGSAATRHSVDRDSQSQRAVSSLIVDTSRPGHQRASLENVGGVEEPSSSVGDLVSVNAEDQTDIDQCHASCTVPVSTSSTSTMSVSSSSRTSGDSIGATPSLNECIRSTLACLKSFRHDTNKSPITDQCLRHPLSDGHTNVPQPPLYRLQACGHVICRHCLGTGTRRCHVCGGSFTRRSVCRVHLVG